MVRETFLADAAGPEDRSGAAVTTSLGEVAVQERHRRHGHKPGVFLLGNRLSLAKLLERVFFQEGFEVVVVDGSGVASPVLAGFLSSLYSAGMVVLCTNTALAPQDLAQFPREDIFEAARILDTAKAGAETTDAQIIQGAVSFAEKLRLSSKHNPGLQGFCTRTRLSTLFLRSGSKL